MVFDHPTGMSLRGMTLLRSLDGLRGAARRHDHRGEGPTTRYASRPRHGRCPTLRTVKPAKNGFTTATGDGNWRVELDEMPPSRGLTNGILDRVEDRGRSSPVESTSSRAESTSRRGGSVTPPSTADRSSTRSGRAEPLASMFDDTTATVVSVRSPESGLTTMLHASSPTSA